MNLLYKENLFISFSYRKCQNWHFLGVRCQLWQLNGVAKAGSSGSCQLWQFRELPKLAVPGVANLAVPGVAKVGNFWTYWNLPKVALEHSSQGIMYTAIRVKLGLGKVLYLYTVLPAL